MKVLFLKLKIVLFSLLIIITLYFCIDFCVYAATVTDTAKDVLAVYAEAATATATATDAVSFSLLEYINVTISSYNKSLSLFYGLPPFILSSETLNYILTNCSNNEEILIQLNILYSAHILQFLDLLDYLNYLVACYNQYLTVTSDLIPFISLNQEPLVLSNEIIVKILTNCSTKAMISDNLDFYFMLHEYKRFFLSVLGIYIICVWFIGFFIVFFKIKITEHDQNPI